GEKSQDTIVDYAREKRLTLISSLNECDALSKKAKEACEKFFSIFEELKKSFSEREQLSFVVEKIVKLSGLDEYYSVQDEITGNQKLANIQEFVNATSLYECSKIGLVEFLDNVVLDRTLGEESEKNKSDNRVSLITIHNTKGLEFPRVIITGMENKIFPRNDKTGEDLEEERRLFYVGITRAKEELYLTSCSFRRMYGRTEMMMPSVFLNEAGDVFRVIGKNVFTNASDNHFQADFASEHYAKSFSSKSDDEKKWKRGLTIYHDDYGYGQIVKTSVSDEGETVIIVQFETGGRKTFLPAYQSHVLTVIRD
ncbi:MAG: ATP-dependent helicase, partial [Treponema sp.]|nr:ATP-dependent helicase [Treponema sp.]